MALLTVKIPLFWRITISLLIVVVLTGASTIYVARSVPVAYGCLQGNGTIIDIQRGKTFPQWFYTAYGGQRYRPRVVLSTPQRTLAASPAFNWAINGKRMVHIDYNYSLTASGVTPWIIIDSPGENIHLERPASTVAFPYYSPLFVGQFVWSDAQYGYSLPAQQLTWSPDGRYILFQYNDKFYEGDGRSHSWHFSIFGIDGSSMIDLAALKNDQSILSVSRAVWSADSRFLLFPKSSVTAEAWAFDTMTRQYYLIGADSKDLPTDGRESRIALPQRQDGNTTITLTGLDGNHSRPLIENADDAGDPSWSPDGRRVAVVWAAGHGNKRIVRLTWANADGSDIHTVEDDFWDIHDLNWLADGRSLAYVAQRSTGVSVEIADLGTGVYRQMGSTYQAIAQLEENPNAGALSFWWHSVTGQTGIDTYRIDGNLAYHTALKLNIDGIEIFRSPYRWIAYPEIFRSPDGSTYAVREDRGWPFNNYPKGMELIAADGSWSRLIIQGSYGSQNINTIYEPLWSPDSKMVVFGGQVGYNPIMTVLRADGTRISDIHSVYTTRGLGWTQCN